MPVWDTPSSSNYSFERVGPATIKRKKKKDGWLDVPGNFLTDIKDSAVGMALAVPRGVGHLTNDIGEAFTGGDDFESSDAAWGMIKAVKDDYAYTYAPLLGIGDAEFNPGLTLSRIKEHPLGPVLDVLALFSGGAAAAGKGGKIAAGTSGSAKGAKWAGLESRGKLFDEAGDIESIQSRIDQLEADLDSIPPRDENFPEKNDPRDQARAQALQEELVFLWEKKKSGNGFVSDSAWDALAPKSTDDLGNFVPNKKWIEAKKAEVENVQELRDRVKELGGVLGPDGEIFLPKTKQITPKGVSTGGYERTVGDNAYKRARQNAVDRFAAKYHNAPMIGASVRGARQNARRADQSSVIEAQALAARLERDAANMEPELTRFFGSAFPSSSVESEIKARRAQMEMLGKHEGLAVSPDTIDVNDGGIPWGDSRVASRLDWTENGRRNARGDTKFDPSKITLRESADGVGYEAIPNDELREQGYKSHSEMFGETLRHDWDARAGYSSRSNPDAPEEAFHWWQYEDDDPRQEILRNQAIIDRQFEDDGYIYRGMSGEELRSILESGKSPSRHDDIDTRYDNTQAGISFSKAPAESADWLLKWAIGPNEQTRSDHLFRKKYIIKMKDDGSWPKGKIERTEREVHSEFVTADAIEDIIEVLPVAKNGDYDGALGVFRSLGRPVVKDEDITPASLMEDIPYRRAQLEDEIARRQQSLEGMGQYKPRAGRVETEINERQREADFLKRAEDMGEMGVASIMNRDAYLNSHEFKILHEGMKSNRDSAHVDRLIDEMAKYNPEGAARLSSIVSDKNKVEGFRGFMRDMLKAYYEKIGPDMVYAKETGAIARGKNPKAPRPQRVKDGEVVDTGTRGMAPEEFAQIQRAFREENQFRELGGNPVNDYADYADAEAEAFRYAEEILGESIDSIRGSSTLGVPVMSHSIVREGVDPDFSTGAGGKPGTLPKPGTPEFMKNTFITNEFALNQMNGPKSIIRALEHAALAKSSTARFRGLISQMYKGANAPGKGWIRLDDNKKSQLRNAVHDIVSFMEDDFTVLSGGNQVDMVATMGETLRKLAADLDAEGDVWVPKGSMKALFNGIERERHMVGDLYANATKIWRNLTLGLRPQWMVNNMVGNLTLLAMEHGLWSSMRSLAVSYKDTFYDEWLQRKGVREADNTSIASVLREHAPAVMETGQYRDGSNTSGLVPMRAKKGAKALDEGSFEAQLKEWLGEQDKHESINDDMVKMSIIKRGGAASKSVVTGQAGLRFNSKWIDDPARRAAFLANMAPHIKRLKARVKNETGESMTNAEAIAHLLKDDAMKDFAISKTLRDMIDYREMTPNERKWLRGTFPFYAWLRGMTKRYAQLTVEKPMLMSAIQHVAEISEQDPDFDDKYPEWMRRMAKIDPGAIADLIRGDTEGGATAVNLSSMNVMQTPADIATLINTLFYGDKDDLAATGSIANYANPYLKAVLETLTGKNLFTGNQLKENVTDPEMSPAMVLARRMGSSFPLIRDAMEFREVQDPEYQPMSEPGSLGYGTFFQPFPNSVIDEQLAMEARIRDDERAQQELERAAEIEKRKKAARG